MKKLLIAVALMALIAGPSFAQQIQAPAAPTEEITVEVQVENYAELTVQGDGKCILHLVDSTDRSSGLNDGVNGKDAHLKLQANYQTDVVITAQETVRVLKDGTYPKNLMALTKNNEDEVLGAWPQGRIGDPDAGQKNHSWQEDTQQIVIDDAYHSDESLYVGDGIEPGIHDIYEIGRAHV